MSFFLSDNIMEDTNSNKPNTEQTRTFLWSIPRSASTSFLTSISHCDDTNGVFWHEPFTQIVTFGSTKSSRRIAGGKRQKGDTLTISGKETTNGGMIFDATKVTLSKIKQELEGGYHGKSVVFVKEAVDVIHNYLEWIPTGYHHTFLIRHPYRVCMSFLGLLKDTKSKKHKADLKQQILVKLESWSMIYDLLEYIKDNHDRNPLIFDADELLLNPAGLMEAYCKDTGIPFTPDLLHWSRGEDIMKTKWMVSKQFLSSFKASKFYASTFLSTGFEKPADLPLRSDIPDELLPIIDRQMPFYEQLYEQSIKCYLFTPLKD